MPEFRYYPGDDAVEGFTWAARPFRACRILRFRDVRGEKSAAAGALTLGYQYAYDGFMLDLFIGPKYEGDRRDWLWTQNWMDLKRSTSA